MIRGRLREGGQVNAEELRSLQAPVKARYKEVPDSARYTLKAEGELGGSSLTCAMATPRGPIVAGLHPAAGGDGLSACSGNMLLEALVGCAGVTMSAVATALGLVIRAGRVRAEGDLDFRGTLGVSKVVAVGFTAIHLIFELDTDADESQLDTLIRLTERYCVVFQTLKNPPSFAVSRIMTNA